MKTAGIIGGIGPESTIEYYRQIVAVYRDRKPDGSYPPVLINSIDLTKMLDMIGADRLPDVTEYLLGEVCKLSRAGADFGALAANTPHVVFDALRPQSPIPLISIVEVTCQAAQVRGLKRVGLFGTRFTMQGRFYPAVFAPAGISAERLGFINAAVNKILASDDMKKFLATEGAEPWPLTPQQLDGLLVSEIERYRKAAQVAGIEPQ